MAVLFLSIARVGAGVCEIEFSHMGKKGENPDLVCKKLLSHASKFASFKPWDK